MIDTMQRYASKHKNKRNNENKTKHYRKSSFVIRLSYLSTTHFISFENDEVINLNKHDINLRYGRFHKVLKKEKANKESIALESGQIN